jgi:AbiV family abortive infection protein
MGAFFVYLNKTFMKVDKEELFSAIRKSLTNAKELFEDAQILKKYNRIARAYTLFQLAIEEIGKAFLVYNFLLQNDFSKFSKFQKEFSNHIIKTETAIWIDMLLFEFANEDLKRKILFNVLVQTKKTNELNNLKNYSLYTSFKNNKFYLPSEIISLEKINKIEFHAKIRLDLASPYLEICMKEFDGILQAYKNMDEEEIISTMSDKMINTFKDDPSAMEYIKQLYPIK